MAIITGDQTTFARQAVDVFFVVSGFLLAGSWLRSTPWQFARNRFLRIFPGLWVCLIVTGLIVPVVLYRLAPAWSYVATIAPLAFGYTNSIPGMFAHNPTPEVNGALWTLRYELWCYLSLPIMMWAAKRDRRAILIVLTGLWITLAIVVARSGNMQDTAPVVSPFRLFTFFYAGATLSVYADRIPLGKHVALVCAALLIIAAALGRVYFRHALGLVYMVEPAALAYLVIYAAAVLPLRRLNTTTDLSYGIYIYGTFLLQIAISFDLKAPTMPYWLLMAAVLGLTIPAAWLSWTLVERPAMSLRRLATVKRARNEVGPIIEGAKDN